MSIIKPVVLPVQAGLNTIQHPLKLHVFLTTSESWSLERNCLGCTGRNLSCLGQQRLWGKFYSLALLHEQRAATVQEDITNLSAPLGAADILLTADWKIISRMSVTHRVRLRADQAKSCSWSGRLAVFGLQSVSGTPCDTQVVFKCNK